MLRCALCCIVGSFFQTLSTRLGCLISLPPFSFTPHPEGGEGVGEGMRWREEGKGGEWEGWGESGGVLC